MQIHNSKKKALESLAREMEKVTQFSHLLSNPSERQALARYSWAITTKENKDRVSPVPIESFNLFSQVFSEQDLNTRLRLAPISYGKSSTAQISSHGSYLLAQAGIDTHSLNPEIRDKACDFISALSFYHNEIYNKNNKSSKAHAVKPFSVFINEKQVFIQKALLHNNPEKATDSFAYELMKSYVPQFDLSKIAFSKTKNHGNVIYSDPNACSVLNMMQSALKFDLKSMGIDTLNYQKSKKMASQKLKEAKKILPSDRASEQPVSKAHKANNSYSEDLSI